MWYWTTEDDETLKGLVTRGFSSSEIAQKLNRTANAVEARRRVLKLKSPFRWTETETTTLIKAINREELVATIHRLIPTRSSTAVADKIRNLRQQGIIAHKVNWHKWTQQEIEYLCQARHAGLPHREIAHILNRGFGSVRTKIIKLREQGILCDRLRTRQWTDVELKQLFNGQTAKELSKHINRSPNAIAIQRFRLKGSQGPEKHLTPPNENHYLLSESVQDMNRRRLCRPTCTVNSSTTETQSPVTNLKTQSSGIRKNCKFT